MTFLLDAAVTALTSKPSSPFHAVETHDVTLVWNYTLDGTVGVAKFGNVTGGGNVEIGRKFGTVSINSGTDFKDFGRK